MKSESDDSQWTRVRSLLREHLTAPPLEHGDFLNTRIREAIEREEARAVRRKPIALRWVLWPGLAALAVAAVLTGVFLPREFGFPSEEAFISHVTAVRAENPRLSVTSFPAPDHRGVVLWIEGATYIPAEEPLQ